MPESRPCPKCQGLYDGEVCTRCLAQFLQSESGAVPFDLGRSFHGYEIGDLLGRGGMGIVYKARQVSLDRTVALKILPLEHSDSADSQARFEREAKSLAALDHPNIVTVYDFGREGEVFFLAMEFVDGPNLRHVLREGRPPLPRTLGLLTELCDALEYAHTAGIVHRDLKPENLLLTSRGTLKIADFGLAKLVGRETQLTQSRVALGTARYMAPEQMANPAAVDHRADLYSAGVLLHELLTGRPLAGPFEPPAVDPRLVSILGKALEREPARRYPSAKEMKRDLEQAQVPRKRWRILVPIGVAALFLLGLGVWRPWSRTIRAEAITFGPREGPLNQPYSEPYEHLRENPLTRRAQDGMADVIRYFQWMGVSQVAGGDLRYAYIVAWPKCSLVVLETTQPEKAEAGFKAGPAENLWCHREGSLFLAAFGGSKAVEDLVRRVRAKLSGSK